LIQDLGPAAQIAREATAAGNPRLKTEDRLGICAKSINLH